MFFYGTASALIVKSTQFFYHLYILKFFYHLYTSILEKKSADLSELAFISLLIFKYAFLYKLLARSDVRINFFQELH